MSNMKAFHVTENDGTDWGVWAAETPEIAFKEMSKAAMLMPNVFVGFPDDPGELIIREIYLH